jgi:hypothetical protein
VSERRAAPRTPARRRPSRRRYLVRRLGALVVLGVVAVALIRLASAIAGGDGGTADADGVPDATDGTITDGTITDGTITDGSITAGTGSDGATAPSGAADASATTVPPATEPESTGPPTSADPAKVLILGDSDAGTFGPYLQTLLDGTGIIDTELDYKVSSGLARPDFFDWPAEITSMLGESSPDIVVATFGGNDAQGLSVASGEFIVGDPVANEAEWTAEYQARVGAVMDQLAADGRTLIWVGIPNDDNPDVTARMAIQDQAAKAAAAERPDVIFVDTWKRFSGRDGNWAEFVIDPRDGQGKDVRADDGFHLNTTGAEILAIDIAQQIRDVLRADGAQI